MTMLSKNSFQAVTTMFRQVSGIQLSDAKQALVAGRLQKLAQARGVRDVDAYVELLMREGDAQELVKVVDKLTTNETYFFREPQHFEHLKRMLAERRAGAAGGDFRVWSAASSSGEEAYSLAMVLADRLGGEAPWEVFGSDISREVVEKARGGVYTMNRIDGIPPDYLRRYCLRGVGSRDGTLQVDEALRRRVRFAQVNLNGNLAGVGEFDVVFLRNVLIYFDLPTKRRIVERIVRQMRPGGWLFIGHSESLNGLDLGLRQERPTIYRRM